MFKYAPPSLHYVPIFSDMSSNKPWGHHADQCYCCSLAEVYMTDTSVGLENKNIEVVWFVRA